MKKLIPLAALASLSVAAPTSAEVVPSSGGGFASSHSATVATDLQQTWRALVHPEDWWTHSWSGEMRNFTLDPRAGGCFCERLPPTVDGFGPGSAEHMRVVNVQPGQMLRMVGALGPLQSEGLSGTLTVTLEPVEQGTRITWEYVLGGQSRIPLDGIAGVVDSVQAEFLGGLVQSLGGAVEQGG